MRLDADLREAVTGAFEDFFRANFTAVARSAALVARDPGAGQDAAQEAFARLFERWADMNDEEHARRFTYRVAVNLARSYVRKHMRLRLSGLASERDRALDPIRSSDDWLTVAEALSHLSGRQRACVVLVDYAGFDAATAAQTLGMGTGTVRVHLMRGRRAIRERLGLDPEGDER